MMYLTSDVLNYLTKTVLKFSLPQMEEDGLKVSVNKLRGEASFLSLDLEVEVNLAPFADV